MNAIHEACPLCGEWHQGTACHQQVGITNVAPQMTNEKDNSTFDYGGICQLDFSEARKGLEASSGPYTRLVIPRTKIETKPNEKDREIKVYHTNKNGNADHCHADYVLKEDHDAFVAEAVKAERERCAERAAGYANRWLLTDRAKRELRSAILSDDQEATDPTDTASYNAYSAGWCDGYKAKGIEPDWIEEGYAKWLKEARRG